MRTSVWTCVQAYTYPSILINGVDMRIHTLAESGVDKRVNMCIHILAESKTPASKQTVKEAGSEISNWQRNWQTGTCKQASKLAKSLVLKITKHMPAAV